MALPIDSPRGDLPPIAPSLRHRGRERGNVVVMALAFTLVIATLLVGSITTTVQQAKTTRYNSDSIEALGLAEGATDWVQKTVQEAVADCATAPTSGNTTIGGHGVSWTAMPIGSPATRVSVDGVTVQGTPLQIDATCKIESGKSSITRIVDLTTIPIFQFAIFSDGDLELFPEQATTVSGRVHVNGDLHLGADTSLTLDTSSVRATGQILRTRKTDGTTPPGTVSILDGDSGTLTAFDPTADSASANWVQSSLATWGGGVRNGDHGVRAVLGPKDLQLDAGGHFETNAGLRIVDTTATDALGNPVPLLPGTITETTLFDEREGQTVTVTEIDLSLLAASGAFPANGLVHARRTDTTSSSPHGIRLTQGASLAAPLTVTTPAPLYIHGDFNTVGKKPAAVMADVVNVLSNAWDDTKSPISALPAATSTTVNCSVITGSVPTTDDGRGVIDSGGFENLLRLHEDWGGTDLDLNGSMVRLFDARFADSAFDPSTFVAPARTIAFDPDLLNPALLPPFCPDAVEMRRVFWDDHQQVEFKIQDSRLSLLPTNTAVSDPWNYDGTFMSKVILDPNR